MELFIGHITNTIVENFLNDKNGGLCGFSFDYIFKLDDSEVTRLGQESKSVVDQREALRARIQTLEVAEKTAQEAWTKAASMS